VPQSSPRPSAFTSAHRAHMASRLRKLLCAFETQATQPAFTPAQSHCECPQLLCGRPQPGTRGLPSHLATVQCDD